ncbi:MAG: GntR family transcriptional regulator [Pseudonocardiales bacterium]|nr:GntR family transcriptional regulator [Pseudonocardiales bacterium]
MGELDPDDARPPYAQVAAALRSAIASGALAPGAKLGSHQTLAEQYGVSVGTVKRALGELQGAGLLISRQGQGAFVRTQLPADAVTNSDAQMDMKHALADLAARVAQIERRLDAL